MVSLIQHPRLFQEYSPVAGCRMDTGTDITSNTVSGPARKKRRCQRVAPPSYVKTLIKRENDAQCTVSHAGRGLIIEMYQKIPKEMLLNAICRTLWETKEKFYAPTFEVQYDEFGRQQYVETQSDPREDSTLNLIAFQQLNLMDLYHKVSREVFSCYNIALTPGTPAQITLASERYNVYKEMSIDNVAEYRVVNYGMLDNDDSDEFDTAVMTIELVGRHGQHPSLANPSMTHSALLETVTDEEFF
ncbi:Cur1p KNAG_0A08010 [Huiozyma naganishii CBS 8797]|uniref:Uncharacterized protein n=1 Tax=Huiozyma naganishii (strain ATCC MYA-139 / BCRC 22969 / CBS 8797 / KCTC 17520 / NBRC 10181 / NCYC 3082 / Yp74L-3) TaxID=1071383 RepID=J7S318_HUIN7|nr:hypothetical protein KNAG_0A08010 [Kazachstania naganishii CBS 8797]CCK68454.1 hypothetical protein KNAG_0A08010 [Kazachstania naganishii CBS 8797]